jgi:hypothetical protein
MNERHRLGLTALWATALLAGCVVHWDPSPENDDYWEGSESDSSVSEGAGMWSEAEPSNSPPRALRPPLTWESEYPEQSPLGDRYRDLIVIDPEIVGGRLAASDVDGAPFSFRAQMQWLAGASREPLEFTRSWLRAWENTSEVGAQLAPVAPRPMLGRVLVDPWLVASGIEPSASPASELTGYGDATGDGAEPDAAESDDPYVAGDDAPAPAESAEPAPGYAEPSAPAVSDEPEPGYSDSDPDEPLPSWKHAPFRLIAIVNRVDLAALPCEGYAGELRYVYAAVDPATSKPLDLTLILEVPYPTTRTAAEWARAWRDLAALAPGEAYTAGLVALTREVQAQGDPLRARLRTNERAFSDAARDGWEMREFDVQIRAGALELAQVPLEFTPRADADPAELSDYVLDHADEIEGKGASLPDNLRAGAARIDAPDFSWSVLGVSERLRRAFSVQTCNGCHGGDTAALPFRHIGAGASLDSPARLSRFLYDPDAATDELRRRSGVLETLGATECEAVTPSEGYIGG